MLSPIAEPIGCLSLRSWARGALIAGFVTLVVMFALALAGPPTRWGLLVLGSVGLFYWAGTVDILRHGSVPAIVGESLEQLCRWNARRFLVFGLIAWSVAGLATARIWQDPPIPELVCYWVAVILYCAIAAQMDVLAERMRVRDARQQPVREPIGVVAPSTA